MFYCLKAIKLCSNHQKGILRLVPNNGIHLRPSLLRHNKSLFKTKLISKPLKLWFGINRWSLAVPFCGLLTVTYIYRKNRADCQLRVDSIIEGLDDKDIESIEKLKDQEKFDFKRLWDYLKPDSLYLLIAITSALIVAIVNIEIPISLGSVMNVLSRFANEENSSFWSNQFFSEIKSPAHKVFQLYLIQSFFTFLYISSLTVVGERMATRIRNQLFSSIIRFDTSFFDTERSGQIISRLTNDVQDFKSSFKLCISQGLRSFTQIIGCSISLFVISPKMTALMITIVPMMVVSGAFIGTFLRKMSNEAQAQLAKTSGIGGETINNIRTVKGLALEERMSNVFKSELQLAEKMCIELGIGIGIFQAMTNFALNGIVLSTLLYGGNLLSKDEISAGNLMSFLIATQTIQKSLSQLSLLFGHYIRGVSAANRVFEYIDIKPSIAFNSGLKLDNIVGEVEFKNVRFSYPTRSEHRVLNDFNLKLIPGKVTAICGLSGEGKSTIASLLERFYDINSGTITVDGYDIRELNPTWLRGHVIGFINQEPILFGTTIIENIRFGKPEASDDEVLKAAKMANADDFIRGFPEGYQTVIGERGVTVSGGQKQRIAIARALIKNPSILILDEATSALDTESEALVQEALEKVMKNRTVLVIAHRLSTIQNADVIAVVSKGKIAETGDHLQLIRSKGLYWNLIKQQFDSN